VKPNAIRVRTRILVLVDSMSPFDRPCSRVCVDGSAVSDDPLLQDDELRDATAPGPADPSVQSFFACLALEDEHQAQALLEQVGPIQPGVGLGDPLQLGALFDGQPLRVRPQRVAAVLQSSGTLVTPPRRSICRGRPAPAHWLGAGQRPGRIPHSPTDLVQGLGCSPLHDKEGFMPTSA